MLQMSSAVINLKFKMGSEDSDVHTVKNNINGNLLCQQPQKWGRILVPR